ncbi:MAG: hypothetical protein D6689_18675 [Deltaproteobacteria bacterium]|nr:MAG: hypothetical protein D6689_18675 [Deltaproteobacteria bacterium]
MPIRTTISAAVAVALAACGASPKEVHLATTSGYDADFAVVYSKVLEAVVELYPYVDENPTSGVIRTAWHQIKISSGEDTRTARGVGVGSVTNPATGGAGGGAFGGTARMDKLYFVRFRVYVLGGKPWRVRIEGEAAEYEPGLKPVPLSGADVPPWLKGRVEALQVAIYRKLKRYAVPIHKSRRRPVARAPAPDFARYGAIPPAAAQRIHALREALRAGRFDAARAMVADDLVWSEGAAPGADQAVALWRADPTLVSRLVAALEAGCAGNDQQVACPAAPAPGDIQATFALVGGRWKLVRAVPVE